MKRIGIVVLMLLGATLIHAATKTEWSLTNNLHGIKTYQRVSPGSSLVDLKGITVIDARMENFGQVLRDLNAFPQWMDMCKQAELVSRIDENNMTLHLVFDFPVVANRDLVVKADTVYDLAKARGIVTLTMVKDSSVPVPAGALRMTDFNGTYVFEYITREKTGVIYTYHADPGGYLPAFAVNIVGKYMLYRTLKNLGAMVKKPQYVQGGLKSKDRALFENILSDEKRVKAILKARLLEYCRDEDMIERVAADQNVVDLLVRGDGTLIEQLFFSWGSRDNLEQAVHTILLTHALRYTSDRKTVEKIAQDKTLINTIIDGSRPGQPTSMQLIESLLVS